VCGQNTPVTLGPLGKALGYQYRTTARPVAAAVSAAMAMAVAAAAVEVATAAAAVEVALVAYWPCLRGGRCRQSNLFLPTSVLHGI